MVRNNTNNSDDEMYETEGDEEEAWEEEEAAWAYDHDHAHDEAEDAEWFGEDNEVWDGHHDENDSHFIDPFSVVLDDCTQILVDTVSNGHAASSIARSSNTAVQQISLEPNSIGCFQITSSASPGNLSPGLPSS